MKTSKQRFIRLGVGLLILLGISFVIYCIVSSPEAIQWTGFRKDTEISRSEKTIQNGKEITTITKDVSGKTLWDWMSVLGVPFSLAVLGFLLQQQQRRIDEQAELEREIAENNQKEEVLQAYFDRLSTLLVDKNLIAIATKLRKLGYQDAAFDEQKELLDAAVDVIRARTSSVLRRLKKDGERKSSVIRFLFEAKVVSKLTLDLSDVNLSDVYLSGADLSGADLSNADLVGADLVGADLNGADLNGADLGHADLSRANFSGANFSGADLNGADLRDANLTRANFSSANCIGADLNGANLIGADLSFANLTGADLNFADLENITWDKNTKWNGAKNLKTARNMPEELKQQLKLTEKDGN